MAVPLFDTSTPLAPLRERLRERALAVLDSGRYILGPEVEAFESELAAATGAGHAVGVANGTDALVIALRALGVEPGDEVVVPSLTFYASAEAIAAIGARPVFCDVDRDTRCVTAQTVRAALTPRTRAVVAVDLLGNVAPIDEIAALGVPVVEDAAQAAGATLGGRAAGSLGAIGTLSFFPSKNLGAFGDGGAVLSGDAELAQRARLLARHGSRDKDTFEAVGYNSRLDELQAALLRVLLGELPEWARARRAAARAYADAGLEELADPPRPPTGCEPAWHLYLVRHRDRERAAAALARGEIGCRTYYATPLHRQPAMRSFAPAGDLPATDELAATGLALPMSPVLGAAQAREVVAALRAAA